MKVLLIDDDPMQRMVLADLLHGIEKVEVLEADDGDAGWSILGSGVIPVLCCCDVLMPGISGIELLRRCRAHPPLAEMPFVVVTVATDRQTITQAIQARATHYLLKPIHVATMRARLDDIFHGIRERYSENPLATLRRMGVTAPRLRDYVEAYKAQLAEATAVVRDRLTNDDAQAAQERLDVLKTGALSLGLWHASRTIEAAPALAADVLERVLAEVETIVDEQLARIKSEFSLPDAPAAKGAAPAAKGTAAAAAGARA